MKEGEFLTREEDLAGFWDLVSIQIDDIKNMFVKLDTLRSGGWKLETPPVRQAKPIATRKTPQGKSTTTSTTPSVATNGLKQTAASRARAEAAKQRLLEAKKAAVAAKQKETIIEAAPSEN